MRYSFEVSVSADAAAHRLKDMQVPFKTVDEFCFETESQEPKVLKVIALCGGIEDPTYA